MHPVSITTGKQESKIQLRLLIGLRKVAIGIIREVRVEMIKMGGVIRVSRLTLLGASVEPTQAASPINNICTRQITREESVQLEGRRFRFVKA